MTNSSPARPILIVSHDAGGAEVLSSWVLRQPRRDLRFCLEGPALAVFRRKLGDLAITPREALADCVEGSDFVLTGSGWASDLERLALRTARAAGKRVVTFLDHWTNYAERFTDDAGRVLPDELWVGDVHARQIAERTFGELPIRLVENPYLQEMSEQVAERQTQGPRSPGEQRVLYVCEPTSVIAEKQFGDARAYGYTEFEALEGYLAYAAGLGDPSLRIRVRRHPAEPVDKYRAILDRFEDSLELQESAGTSLVEDCAWADTVVGCESMALVVGLYAGKRVCSSLPEGSRPSSLPFPEIVSLFKR